jgi:hypothetical protein
MALIVHKRLGSDNEGELAGYGSAARESACDPGAGAPLALTGTFYSAEVQLQSTAGAAEWLFVFDKLGALAGADVPIVPPVQVPVGGKVAIDLGSDGVRFSAGLRVALSTSDTFAASATAKGLFRVKFAKTT